LLKALFDYCENFVRIQNLVFPVIQFDFSAAVFAEQDAVTDLHFKRHFVSLVVPLASSYGDDLSFCWFFLGGVGMTIPPLMVSFSSMGSTKTRPPKGLTFGVIRILLVQFSNFSECRSL
jgi:hypothetical protein